MSGRKKSNQQGLLPKQPTENLRRIELVLLLLTLGREGEKGEGRTTFIEDGEKMADATSSQLL